MASASRASGFAAKEDEVEEVDRWVRFGFVIGSVVVTALFLYGALSNDIGKLHDEVKRLRAEIRCLAEPDECDVTRLLSEMRSKR